MKLRTVLFYICTLFVGASVVCAEDGSRLWLPKAESRKQEAESVGAHARVISNRKSPVISVALRELQNHWKG
ncbi:MAG: hypothetical protein LBD45_05750, partial [Bacteroidales bacterium]|nr:hypothetical protein [Bacteroidales bacterium]